MLILVALITMVQFQESGVLRGAMKGLFVAAQECEAVDESCDGVYELGQDDPKCPVNTLRVCGNFTAIKELWVEPAKHSYVNVFDDGSDLWHECDWMSRSYDDLLVWMYSCYFTPD